MCERVRALRDVPVLADELAGREQTGGVGLGAHVQVAVHERQGDARLEVVGHAVGEREQHLMHGGLREEAVDPDRGRLPLERDRRRIAKVVGGLAVQRVQLEVRVRRRQVHAPLAQRIGAVEVHLAERRRGALEVSGDGVERVLDARRGGGERHGAPEAGCHGALEQVERRREPRLEALGARRCRARDQEHGGEDETHAPFFAGRRRGSRKRPPTACAARLTRPPAPLFGVPA